MQVISKKTFEFFDENIEQVPTGDGDKTVAISKPKASVVVQLSPNPQEVPDWVGNCEHFKIAVDDGDIMEVLTITKPKAKKDNPFGSDGLKGK